MASRRLRWLVAAHLTLGVVACVLAPIEVGTAWMKRSFLPHGLELILTVPFLALALCQALLLALWGAASTAEPWRRLAGLVVGAVYLEALFLPLPVQEFRGLSTVTIAVTSLSLLMGRALGIGLIRRSGADQAPRPEREGLRFSIRGLMLLTAAVALLSAGGRLLQSAPARFLLLIDAWSLCFVAVGLVALWAALGTVRPRRRAPFVFVLSPVLGILFAYAVGAHPAGCFYITLTMLLYPAALLGSLLVLRSCGYRLVRRAASSVITADGEQVGDVSAPPGVSPGGATTSG